MPFMRACELGRLSFAYFSIAVDRKVSRHEGEIECLKDLSAIKKHKGCGANTGNACTKLLVYSW